MIKFISKIPSKLSVTASVFVILGTLFGICYYIFNVWNTNKINSQNELRDRPIVKPVGYPQIVGVSFQDLQFIKKKNPLINAFQGEMEIKQKFTNVGTNKAQICLRIMGNYNTPKLTIRKLILDNINTKGVKELISKKNIEDKLEQIEILPHDTVTLFTKKIFLSTFQNGSEILIHTLLIYYDQFANYYDCYNIDYLNFQKANSEKIKIYENYNDSTLVMSGLPMKFNDSTAFNFIKNKFDTQYIYSASEIKYLIEKYHLKKH